AHVESVAWIIERKDVLSGFFYLLAFLTYLQFDEQRGIASYGGAMILFLAALLSKSVAVTLPVAIGIALWWKRGLGKRDLITLAPFAVLGVVFALFDSRLAHRLAGYDSHLSFAGRILVAMRATIFYGGKSFWPAPLTMNHPRWNMEAPSAGSVVLSVASILIPFLLWSARRRIGKGPLAAALFFGVTLGPTSGIIDHAFMNYSFVADRFQYLASIGPILIVAGIGEAAADRFGLKKPLAKIGVCLACLALASITWRRAETFRDTFSVFSDALRKNPDSWLAHFNLGREMEKTKDPASAADHYTKAVQLNPNFIEGFNNLGLLDLGQRRFAEAAEHFGRAIKLNPKFAKSWNNLGLLQLETGQFDQAAASFTHSLELKGEDSETLTNLGVVFSRSGKPAEAVPYLERAIKADPANVKAMNNLGSAFFTLGQPAKAEDYFRLAATARPDYVNAWVNLGSAQLQQGRGSEAAQSFQRALQLDPANPTAQAGLRQARPGSK
ncbi:tetratricopeptide repeat protein, partial [Candidatus Sumerlaeota bacterium]|nr:tetratricopeptide repeat protein [Candidatus Sumerlaeota bacterium]